MKLTSLLSTGTTWKERQIRLIFTNAPPTKHTAKLLEKYEAFFHLAPPPLRHFGKTETGKRRSNWRLLHTAPVNILWIILGSITKQGLGYKVTPNRITPSVTICLTGVFFIHYNILLFFCFHYHLYYNNSNQYVFINCHLIIFWKVYHFIYIYIYTHTTTLR